MRVSLRCSKRIMTQASFCVIMLCLAGDSTVAFGQSCPACDNACYSGSSQFCGGVCLNCVACGAVYKAVCQGGAVNCVQSPIIIDVSGEGFHLTSKSAGVKFTFGLGEPPRQTSWTAPGYSNGWLALDRNGNGAIDNATELFGDLTPQPPDPNPNGYKALAVFDDPKQGGNGNGKIDPGDAVFSRLRVWVDRNHNGISEPNELLTLAEAGINWIDLTYIESGFVDQFGNQFRFSAKISSRSGGQQKQCYDVLLVVDPLPPGTTSRNEDWQPTARPGEAYRDLFAHAVGRAFIKPFAVGWRQRQEMGATTL